MNSFLCRLSIGAALLAAAASDAAAQDDPQWISNVMVEGLPGDPTVRLSFTVPGGLPFKITTIDVYATYDKSLISKGALAAATKLKWLDTDKVFPITQGGDYKLVIQNLDTYDTVVQIAIQCTNELAAVSDVTTPNIEAEFWLDVPPAIDGLTAVATSPTSIRLDWNAVTDPHDNVGFISSFRIVTSAAGDVDESSFVGPVAPEDDHAVTFDPDLPPPTSVELSGLTPGTTYHAAIKVGKRFDPPGKAAILKWSAASSSASALTFSLPAVAPTIIDPGTGTTSGGQSCQARAGSGALLALAAALIAAAFARR